MNAKRKLGWIGPSCLLLVIPMAALPIEAVDCNANGIEDACDLDCGVVPGPCDVPGCGQSEDCDANGVPDECDLAVGASGCPFPWNLLDNGTGADPANFVGPPDDLYYGLGGQVVTYDFRCAIVFDGPGPDLTIYEIDGGTAEFGTLGNVLVSADGTTFYSVKASEGPAVRIPGDEGCTNLSFARSYELGDGLPRGIRYVRLDGSGTGAAGPSAGFDLDATGAVHRLGRDCDGSGVLDACEGLTDCNANGIPDSCEIAAALDPDCNGNGVVDACDISSGSSADCDGNAIPDECDMTYGADGCPFPPEIFENTTGAEGWRFTGPPDDQYWGLGGQIVTLEFGCGFVTDLAGPDITVYELDGGAAEFELVDVLVSDDGVAFVSVKATETAAVDIPGDEQHGSSTFARSYDLGGTGLRAARFIRLDGVGTGAAGASTNFDLDAVGAIHRFGRDCDASGVLDACEPAGDCDGNLLADSCELALDPDCNGTGVLDECDVVAGTSTDYNLNRVPDECEPDCNDNQRPDDYDIAQGTSTDCNHNAAPDECDLAAGSSLDCNGDQFPDECPICPPVEVAFVMDTSTSMNDEGAALCSDLAQVIADLQADLIAVDTELLGIPSPGTGIYSCLTESVAGNYGTDVPGSPPPGNETLGECPGGNEVALEDWGRATSVVAGNKPWLASSVRLVVPISDEGPWCGDPTSDPGVDRDSIVHAIGVSLDNGVIVSPVTCSGSTAAMINLAQQLADATGGQRFSSTLPAGDLSAGIEGIIVAACDAVFDCNGNDVPDECDLDSGTSRDCNLNDRPDECEADCNHNGIEDSCDLAGGNSPDVNANAVPDECEAIELTADATHLNWTAVDNAIGYDLVGGDLPALRASAGNFTSSTTDCLANDTPNRSYDHTTAPDPASGAGWWYLVRAVLGTVDLGYDDFRESQVASRDDAIAASPEACP